MQRVKSMLARIAASRASTVLLTGETGTGKDLAAKAIHYNSDRVARAFVNITCSALPEQLLESELFGHERGAFTDARQQKRGLFESADGGTAFLDEIGEMTPALQANCCASWKRRLSSASAGSPTSAWMSASSRPRTGVWKRSSRPGSSARISSTGCR